MSGESWLAIKDSLTHQSWVSRPGIQCFLLIYVLYLFLPFIFYFFLLISGVWQGAGAARFGCTTYILMFDKVFNRFTFWRPLSSTSLCLQVFIGGKTSLVPSF